MRRFHKDLAARLREELGADEIEFAHTGKHPRLSFTIAGRRCCISVSNTPSTCYALENALRTARRVAGAP